LGFATNLSALTVAPSALVTRRDLSNVSNHDQEMGHALGSQRRAELMSASDLPRLHFGAFAEKGNRAEVLRRETLRSAAALLRARQFCFCSPRLASFVLAESAVVAMARARRLHQRQIQLA
jgi:hypothetical protein